MSLVFFFLGNYSILLLLFGLNQFLCSTKFAIATILSWYLIYYAFLNRTRSETDDLLLFRLVFQLLLFSAQPYYTLLQGLNNKKNNKNKNKDSCGSKIFVTRTRRVMSLN